jgi:hypothetical protein
MSISGIILMWVCYVPVLFATISFITYKKEGVYLIILLPLILLGVGLMEIKRTDIKQPRPQYEEVTETFYKKVK